MADTHIRYRLNQVVYVIKKGYISPEHMAGPFHISEIDRYNRYRLKMYKDSDYDFGWFNQKDLFIHKKDAKIELMRRRKNEN